MTVTAMSRELLGKIVDEVFDGAIEDASVIEEIHAVIMRETALAAAEPIQPVASFQDRVQPWLMACFGPEISADKLERSDRFMEEALELVQAGDYPKERVYALVEYVYGRDQGEINQEVGGVMVTLAAHCLAHGVDMHAAAETELARIWTKVENIRAKQAAKPTGSALPVVTPAPSPADRGAVEALIAFADDLMELDDGETVGTLSGYSRGAYFTAKSFRERLVELAALALPAGEVKVKALEWTRLPGTDDWRANSPVGTYMAGLVHASYVATRRFIEDDQWQDDVFAHVCGVEEAKAAAQADYEARILSALAAPSQAREGE